MRATAPLRSFPDRVLPGNGHRQSQQVASEQTISRGEPEAAEAIFERFFTDFEWTHVTRHFHLTPRQCTVARLLCMGYTHRSIARQMGVSLNTVRMHLRALFLRLNVHDRVSVFVRLQAAARVLAESETHGD